MKNIRRATRWHFSAEDKIRIVLEGLRGDDSIAELCRKEGMASASVTLGPRSSWKQASAATTGEVQDLRREARALKECVALALRERPSACWLDRICNGWLRHRSKTHGLREIRSLYAPGDRRMDFMDTDDIGEFIGALLLSNTTWHDRRDWGVR